MIPVTVRAAVRRQAQRAPAVRLPGMASVMIVDDNADACEPLANFLGRAGHVVRCVQNGREALVGVIQEPPDVVVLDLILPDMDGPTFLEVVRSYLRLQSLPVVVLTGLPDSPIVARIQQCPTGEKEDNQLVHRRWLKETRARDSTGLTTRQSPVTPSGTWPHPPSGHAATCRSSASDSPRPLR